MLGETPAILGGTLTFDTTATTSSGPGAYPIVPGGLSSSNYAISFLHARDPLHDQANASRRARSTAASPSQWPPGWRRVAF